MGEFWKKVTAGDIRNIIAIISVIGGFIMFYLIVIKPIPAENKDTVNMTVGVLLGGLIGGVNGYYFGASKSENKKEE